MSSGLTTEHPTPRRARSSNQSLQSFLQFLQFCDPRCLHGPDGFELHIRCSGPKDGPRAASGCEGRAKAQGPKDPGLAGYAPRGTREYEPGYPGQSAPRPASSGYAARLPGYPAAQRVFNRPAGRAGSLHAWFAQCLSMDADQAFERRQSLLGRQDMLRARDFRLRARPRRFYSVSQPFRAPGRISGPWSQP